MEKLIIHLWSYIKFTFAVFLQKWFRHVKGNKEDDDKMRTTAANVAARAAVGGDDAFLKWQLMAEARQKSVSEAGKDGNQKTTSGGGKNSKDRQDGGRRFSGTGESILFNLFPLAKPMNKPINPP